MKEAGEGKIDRPISAIESPVRHSRPVQVVALVKPFRAQAVLSALESVEDSGWYDPGGDGIWTAEEPAGAVPGKRV